MEALTQIRALCDERDPSGKGSPFERAIWPHEVRAVPVDATPPQGIDRGTARAFLAKLGYADPELYDIEGMVDELALARPVEGVVLSREEAEAMQAALAVSLETEPWSEPIASTLRTLASRLEASA